MKFIDMVDWQPSSNDVFAYKFPENNLSTFTQLVVRESQEAVLFSKGKIMGKFGPGKHTLSTENLPILRNLFGIPFGGKNPFTAEVWFVNKAAPLTIDWTTSTMRFLDPEYGQMVPLVAQGRYGLKVQDAERFLVQLVGTLTSFNSRQLTDHFQGAMEAKTKSAIISFMNSNRVSVMAISGYLDQLSEFIKQPLTEFWENYGFQMTGYYITSVDIDTSTPDGQKISEAMAERSAQNIAGYTWQQKQGFGTVNNAIDGMGKSSMGALGAVMMTGMMANNNSGFGSAMMAPTNNGQFMSQQQGNMGMNNMGMNNMNGGMQINQNQGKMVFCSSCSKKFPSTSAFCPNCGHKYNPCPVCGSDNAENARRCVTCGASLMGSNMNNAYVSNSNCCPRCGAPASPGVRFCTKCGNKLF